MKKIILGIFLFSNLANAYVILAPGTSEVVGGETVYCRKESPVEIVYAICSCDGYTSKPTYILDKSIFLGSKQIKSFQIARNLTQAQCLEMVLKCNL